jgi:predicted XRE-type DNA-binding protein
MDELKYLLNKLYGLPEFNIILRSRFVCEASHTKADLLDLIKLEFKVLENSLVALREDIVKNAIAEAKIIESTNQRLKQKNELLIKTNNWLERNNIKQESRNEKLRQSNLVKRLKLENKLLRYQIEQVRREKFQLTEQPEAKRSRLFGW